MKKKLRFILFFFCSVIVLIAFATILLPSKGQVARAVTIYAPKNIVLKKLKKLKSYPQWFPWLASDPNKNIIYYGSKTNILKGFSFRDKQGKKESLGRYELERQQGDSMLYFNLHFENMPDFNGVYLLKGDTKSTTLVWEMTMHAGWKPWWRFYAIVMNKITRPVLDSGLDRLKAMCEHASAKENL